MEKYIVFSIIALLIVSCSTQSSAPKPVRSGRSMPRITDSRRGRAAPIDREAERKQSQAAQNKKTTANEEELAALSKRYSDTTIVELSSQFTEKSLEIVKKFDSAIERFDNELYKEACPEFSALAGTFNRQDSLYFEAEFYICECLIVNEKLDEAEGRLLELASDLYCTAVILEKSLLRIGHIYCAKGNVVKANYYFDQLKRMNSDSFLIPYANCEGF